jgi:hypothetical protein
MNFFCKLRGKLLLRRSRCNDFSNKHVVNLKNKHKHNVSELMMRKDHTIGGG